MDFNSAMLLWFECIAITVKIVQIVNDTMLTQLSRMFDLFDGTKLYFRMLKIVLI